MYEVRVTDTGRAEFESLPLRMQPRVQEVFNRLVYWPDVSGVKPLKGSLRGAHRIRSGDWRVLFIVDEAAKRVTVFRVANRRNVYDD